MKILFETGFAQYDKRAFPRRLTCVPRKGEHVLLNKKYVPDVSIKKPIELLILRVIWGDGYALCHLGRTDKDINSELRENVNAMPDPIELRRIGRRIKVR